MRGDIKSALSFIAGRLSPDALSVGKLDEVLRRKYPALDSWPVDAQLGLYVLGWVLGPGFTLAGFAPAVNRLVPDFAAAARAVSEQKEVPAAIVVGGIARQAFRNAGVVLRWNLDPDILYWPVELSDCTGGGTL